MRFDTRQRDYTNVSVNNIPTRSVSDAAYIRLSTQRGTLFSDPEMGSKLYLLKRAKDVSRKLVLAKRYALEALEPLRDAYFLTDISVTVRQPRKSFIEIVANLTTSNGLIEHVTVKVPVQG